MEDEGTNVLIKVIKFNDLGFANHGWLKARHHFSFASYYDPDRMGFGAIRVINDDVIAAGMGFDTHPHRNMEIITYVKTGAITHKDSQGNEGRTAAGDVQVMSAGSGVFHSEFNKEGEATTLYQIWIEPNVTGVTPTWKAHSFPKGMVTDKLSLLVSGEGSAPLTIHQDAFIYAGSLSKGTTIIHQIVNQAYLLVVDGALEVDGERIEKGDGVEIVDLKELTLTAVTEAQVLLLDVPDE